MNKQQIKQQIISDAKEAQRELKLTYDLDLDDVAVSIELLERLAQYARLLAMEIKE